MTKVLFLIFVLLSNPVHAENRKAFIYKIGDTAGSPLFTQTTEITEMPSGERHWTSKIEDPSGSVVMTEKARMKDGRMLYQFVEQLQINEAYELKVDGKNVTFLTYKIEKGDKGNPIKSETKVVGDNFITGPLTESYLISHWQELLDNKSVSVDFGVFEVSRPVEFRFHKIASTDKNLEIKMKPANLFISMFVDSMLIDFDSRSKRMVRFQGRTPLRKQVKGKWEAIDAEIIYK